MPRYIDADALIDFLDVGHLRHPSELCFSEIDVANLLLHAPTISPDEVRGVGEWIDCPSTHIQDGAKYRMCSVCNEHIAVLGHDLIYCPNCGAKMKGDNNGTTD